MHQSPRRHEQRDGRHEGQDEPKVREREHRVDLVPAGKADAAERKAHAHADGREHDACNERRLRSTRAGHRSASKPSDTTMPAPKNVAVASRLPGCRRLTPTSPCPDVQPPAMRVPNPVSTPPRRSATEAPQPSPKELAKPELCRPARSSNVPQSAAESRPPSAKLAKKIRCSPLVCGAGVTVCSSGAGMLSALGDGAAAAWFSTASAPKVSAVMARMAAIKSACSSGDSSASPSSA